MIDKCSEQFLLLFHVQCQNHDQNMANHDKNSGNFYIFNKLNISVEVLTFYCNGLDICHV